MIRSRGRPRLRSVDFSRLWWLLATEAAFQVRLQQVPYRFPPTGTTGRSGWTFRQLARIRADARSWLARKAVML